MRMPQGTSARDRAIRAGFFWAEHQHDAAKPIIDEVTWDDLAALPRQPCPATLRSWDGTAPQSGNVALSASCPHCGSGLPYDHTLDLGRQMLAESEFRARHSQCQPAAILADTTNRPPLPE
jgi:hypothetical protein